MKFIRRTALLSALAAAGPAHAQFSAGGTLLDLGEAFRLSARALDAHSVELRFSIAPGYYLYRERFRFATPAGTPLAGVQIPRGTMHEDDFFGRQETFRDAVSIRVPVSPADAARSRVTLKVTSQGCADVGICYLPQTQRVEVALPAR